MGNPHKNIHRGIYFHYLFRGGTEVVSELERTFRMNDKVLRFMHVRLETDDFSQHLEGYKTQLLATASREKEREARRAAKRSAPTY